MVELSCVGFGSVLLSSSGTIRWARTLPSSTPHWSNELMCQIGPLHEDLVLVEGDQLAERLGREAFEQQRVGRMISLEGAVRDEFRGHAVGFHLVGRLAEGQGLGLGEELAISRSWCRPSGLSVWQKPMKSQGISFVPWWMSW